MRSHAAHCCQQIVVCLTLVTGALAASAAVRVDPTSAPSSVPNPSEQLGDMPINDSDPEKSLPTPEQAAKRPVQFGYLLMDLATKAELAEKRGKFGEAVKYYQALASAVPHRSISYGRMCAAYEAMGDRQNGLESCRHALGREGARVDDYIRYVRLLLANPGPIAKADLDEVNETIKHLAKDPATKVGADDIECQLGARVKDVKLLDKCVEALTASAPGDLKTLYYSWVLAIERGDLDQASHLLLRAKAAGLGPVGAERMEKSMGSLKRRRHLPFWGGLILALAGLALLARKHVSGLVLRMTRNPA